MAAGSVMLVAGLLLAISAPAWAINKCTGPDGKVVYQDAPCSTVGAGQAGQTVKTWDNTVRGIDKPPPRLAAASEPAVAPPTAATSLGGSSQLTDADAERCFAWYRVQLRDPRSAYYRDASRSQRMVTMTIYATNGFGGYVPKQAACEFNGTQLDEYWTKTQAQRTGWLR